MKIGYGVSGAEQLPPAYQRAVNIQRDLGKAIGLFGLGDCSEVTFRTLARAKVIYDAVGSEVPAPYNISEEAWLSILRDLVRRYGFRAFVEKPCAA